MPNGTKRHSARAGIKTEQSVASPLGLNTTGLNTTNARSRRDRIERVLFRLATEIGPRNIHHYGALCQAAEYIGKAFRQSGYDFVQQSFEAHGKIFSNIISEQKGERYPKEIVVVGAHYDTHKDSPGANDNGSAVSALLELANAASDWHPQRTLRFVAFTNEETPFTRTHHMGSHVYARACREAGDNIVGMVCLETLGCCSDEIGSQWLSFGGLLLPRRGNFIALVADRSSRPLMQKISASFESESSVPHRALTLPRHLPGARSSDHWSFWRHGFNAVMVTDTAPLRYRHYHKRTDTPDKIDVHWLEHVIEGLEGAVRSISGRSSI